MENRITKHLESLLHYHKYHVNHRYSLQKNKIFRNMNHFGNRLDKNELNNLDVVELVSLLN